MEYNVFPSVYEAQERGKEDSYKKQKTKQMEQSVQEKTKEYGKKSSRVKRYEKTFGSYLSAFCTGVGVAYFVISILTVIGLAIYYILTLGGLEGYVKILACVGGVIGGAVVGAIAGAIAGVVGGAFHGFVFGVVFSPIGFPIYRVVCNKKQKKAVIKLQEIEREKSEAIERIKESISAEIAKHSGETEHRITQYTEEFEQEAQRKSVNFANSELAKEVIQWLADGFLKTVKAADRASHIEKIVVPFRFNVEKGEISCNIGKYNFKEHRCEQLQDILSQAALARAIASQVQLNIIMQFDKDISGTEYKIDIAYDYYGHLESNPFSSYQTEYVLVNLVYAASNGNYKPEQKW